MVIHNNYFINSAHWKPRALTYSSIREV